MKPGGALGAVTVALAVAAGWSGTPPVPAAAAIAPIAYPGMTIHQGNAFCTLGYVDPDTGLGYSAGHCAAAKEVRDDAGDLVGHVIAARNTAKTVTGPGDHITDVEIIQLHPAVMATDHAGPTFIRPLNLDPDVQPRPGMPVCHLGATTGQSCGEITAVYNGWFTMVPGDDGDFTSDDGDSGGPVWTTVPGQSAPVLIGLFRGTHGHQFVAVNWSDINLS